MRIAFTGLVALMLAGCGGGSGSPSSSTARSTLATAPGTTTRTAPVRRPPPPTHPHLLASGPDAGSSGLAPIVRWRGQPAAWIRRTPSGLTVLVFDQRLAELHLHSGTTDAGASGWRFGPNAVGAERRRLIAAFNGGFRLSVGDGGFMSYGRVAVPLRRGVGSIVTYANGRTDIGSWRQEVPAAGQRVVSVRQNLPLLVDRGSAAATTGCLTCWGATLGGVVDPARSALGISADGRLIWAAGEHLTVAQLASGLLSAGAVRAVELDINPEWVAGYVYGHHGRTGPVVPVAVVNGQQGIPGAFLAPWSRDFFTIAAR